MNYKLKELTDVKALLLDLDGTLINSEKAFFESFKNVLYDNFNISITMEDYKKYELEQNAMLLKQLRKNYSNIENISDNEIMSLIYRDYEKEFRKVIFEEESIENFTLLKELKKLKYKLALVTTCRRYYLDILIKELLLEDLFDIIIAREDTENLKPAPDAYLKALECLKLNREYSLAIEDSKRGIDAAINSNLKTIQVNNFTSIKYTDDRCIQFDSANEVLNKILELKRLVK